MKTTKWLLAGILTAASAACICKSKNNLNLESRVSPAQPSSKPAERNTKGEREYDVIKEMFIRDFLEEYLEKVTPNSDNFQKLDKKYGKEGLLEEYASAHELCLNLAYKNQGKKISEEMYDNLAVMLAEKQQETSKGVSPVNNLNKSVVGVYEKWGREKTKFFIKLLDAARVENYKGNKEEYGLRLIRKAYTREEYKKYAENFSNITDELYDAMKKTLGIGAFFDSGQFKLIADYTRKAYIESDDKYFKEESK